MVVNMCPLCFEPYRLLEKCKKCGKFCCSKCSLFGLCHDCYIQSFVRMELDTYFSEKYIVKEVVI